jgi:hydrophobe/amphiphile efflux-3 (HAE3) family protein
MKKLSTFILKFRLAFIIVIVLITSVFAFFIKDLKINPDITTYLPKNDSVVARFNYIGKSYSASSLGVVIVENQNGIFNKETLKNINGLTSKFKSVEGVNFVTSLTSVLDIKKTDDGLEISRLMDEYNIPQTPEEIQKIKDYTMSKSIYKGRLISEDGKYTAIVCRISQDADKNTVAKELKKIVTESGIPEKTYLDGVPFQFLTIQEFIINDLILLTPLIVLIISISLLVSFRNLRGILLPIIAVAMGIIWSMGLMSIMGVKLTPISDAIPVVLYAIASSYGIYIINKFRDTVTNKETKMEDAREGLAEVGLAVILSGLTTFAGFLSFVFGAYLTIISDFGIFMALGVIFNLIIAITFIPAVLSYLPVQKKKNHENPEVKRSGILERFLGHLAEVIIKRKKLVLALTCIVVLLFLAGIPLIKNNIDILNYFRPNTSIRQSAKVMNKEFGGSIPIQVLVRGDIQDPKVLGEMKRLQNFLNNQKDVKNAQSVADFIEEMNDCMGEGKKIPDSRDKVANLWFLIEGEDLIKQLVNDEKSEAIVQASMVNVETKRYHEINNDLDNYISEINDNSFTMAKTGMPSIYASFDDNLMSNLFQSIILSILLIFICMLLLLKSLKGAIVGMIPLLMTMGFIFGFMGLTGIALDIATVLIASITVGAGIDYAIHFITTYTYYIKNGWTVSEAIRETMVTKGKAIIISVFTIMFGFLVLVFANLMPLQQFGILIAVTMFCSGFGAITVLPSVISLFNLKLVKEKYIKKENH